jgi:Vps52 / Sac2 family
MGERTPWAVLGLTCPSRGSQILEFDSACWNHENSLAIGLGTLEETHKLSDASSSAPQGGMWHAERSAGPMFVECVAAHERERSLLFDSSEALREQQGAIDIVESRLADLVKNLEQLCAELEISYQACQAIAISHQASTTIATHIDTFIDEASLPDGLEDYLQYGTTNGLQLVDGIYDSGDDNDNSLTFSLAVQLVSKKVKFYKKESTRKIYLYEHMKPRVDSLLVLAQERCKKEIYSSLERMQMPGTNIRILRDVILIKKCIPMFQFLQEHDPHELSNIRQHYLRTIAGSHADEMSQYSGQMFDNLVRYRARAVSETSGPTLSSRLASLVDTIKILPPVELAVVHACKHTRPLFFEEIFRNVAQKLSVIAEDEQRSLNTIFGDTFGLDFENMMGEIWAKSLQLVNYQSSVCADTVALALSILVSRSLSRKISEVNSAAGQACLVFHTRAVDEGIKPRLDDVLDSIAKSLLEFKLSNVASSTVLGWTLRYGRVVCSLRSVIYAGAVIGASDENWASAVSEKLDHLQGYFLRMLENCCSMAVVPKDDGHMNTFHVRNLQAILEIYASSVDYQIALQSDIRLISQLRDARMDTAVDYLLGTELNDVLQILSNNDLLEKAIEDALLAYSVEWELRLLRIREHFFELITNVECSSLPHLRSHIVELGLRKLGSRMVVVNRNLEVLVAHSYPHMSAFLVPNNAIMHWARGGMTLGTSSSSEQATL